MREQEVAIQSEVEIAGVLCLPDDVDQGHPVPAMVLLGGSGADTRDGDLVIERAGGFDEPPVPGTLRLIAHQLATCGVASVRWDRRGFGASGGDPAEVDYDTDLVDATACFDWFVARPEVDGAQVAVAGHSAGALVASRLCRDRPTVAGAALLGALSSPIEDMLRWNVGRVAQHWDRFSDDQRAWLRREMPASLVRAEGVERLIEAARQGEEMVVLEGHGVKVEARTARLRQDLATSYADELRVIGCPALVLHGGDDLNVPVEDALRSYRVLREAGNDDVELVILPGLEHYFCPVPRDPGQRVWERITRDAIRKPMAPLALRVIAAWTERTLRG